MFARGQTLQRRQHVQSIGYSEFFNSTSNNYKTLHKFILLIRN